MTQSSNAATGTWYYAIGSDRQGPVAVEALKMLISSGQVPAGSLVWTDGMPNWVAAATVPELAAAVAQQTGSMQAQPGAQISPGYSAPVSGDMLNYYASNAPTYGGFWLRFAAAFLDGLILVIPTYLVQFGIRAAFGLDLLEQNPGPTNTELAATLIVFVINTVIGWLYSALQESSERGATLGKRACGLRVTDMAGGRISFARATGRHFGKWISTLTLLIGFIMAAFTARRQALHDIMAGTLVIRTK